MAKTSAKAAPKKAAAPKAEKKVAAKAAPKAAAKAPAKKAEAAKPAKEEKKVAAPKVEKKVAEKPAKKAEAKKTAPAKKVAVVFEADCPLATTVSVAGSFNNWSVEANPLKKDKKSGLWTAKISLAAGDYEYKFVCDGVNWDAGDNKIKHV